MAANKWLSALMLLLPLHEPYLMKAALMPTPFQLLVSLELMTERPSLRRLRFRGLGGRNASLFSAHEHLHGALAFARLVGVFVGVR